MIVVVPGGASGLQLDDLKSISIYYVCNDG
jgi:hypothetical protein